MTTTSSAPEAAALLDRRRDRIERLLQITGRAYDLRFAFGARDAVDDDRVVLGIDAERAVSTDYAALKGKALHLLGHLLTGWGEAAEAAAATEKDGAPRFAHLWHALEDARLENWMIRRWPGMGKTFRAAWPPDLVGPRGLRIPADRQIEAGLYWDGRGLPRGRLREDVQEALRQGSSDIQRGAEGAHPQDSLEAFKAIYPHLRPLLGPGPGARPPERREGRGPEGLGSKRTVPRESPPSESEPWPHAIEIEEGSVEVRAMGRQRAMPDWYRPGGSPWFERGLGEKKVHPAAERGDSETIVIPPRGDPAAYRRLWMDVQHEAGNLWARLLRMLEEDSYLRFGGRYRSGKLEMNKLWRQRLGDYRLFQRRVPGGRRALAVGLMVDESASMQAHDKHTTAAKAAILLGESLSRLEIPLEIIGFTTAGFEAREAMRLGLTPAHEYRTMRCSPLEHRIYKAFHEPYRFVRSRLAGIQPRHNNWDEEHLLFGYRRLRRRPEPVHLLLVVSDGQPNGDADNLIHVVAGLEKEGCRVVGIGIGEDFVRRIYRHALVVSDFRQMSEALIGLLGHELGLRERSVPLAAGGSVWAW